MDTAGVLRRIDTVSQQNGDQEFIGSYSRNGQIVYFTSYYAENRTIAQVPANGSGPPSGAEANPGTADFWPSPSPDGSQVVFNREGFGNSLMLLNTFDGSTTATNVAGSAPSWAPQGALIAYNDATSIPPGSIDVVNADGSGQRTLSAGANYDFGVDWSPDGQWIVASNLSSGHLDLINVTSGLTVPLLYTHNLKYPTWRPTTASAGAQGVARVLGRH